MRYFILNADDFGLTEAHNLAVYEGYKTGILTSASICANGNAFDNAIKCIPDCKNLGLAVHLNIMEGNSLTNCPLLTDENNLFNKDYAYLLQNQFNKEILSQIKNEFKAQIEKVLNAAKVDHLDSHIHTHAIPFIFKIVCELAKEYDIPYIRTQMEKPYFVPGVNLKPINLVKILLLNFFTLQNIQTLKRFNLKTNDNFLGVGYTGMMSSKIIECGLTNIKNGTITEVVIHPCKYSDNTVNSHSEEFDITKNELLKGIIGNLGFNFTNYSNLERKLVRF